MSRSLNNETPTDNNPASKHAPDEEISVSGVVFAGSFSLVAAGAIAFLVNDASLPPIPTSVLQRVRENYGTLLEPLFKVDESLEYADFSNFRDFLALIPQAQPHSAYETRIQSLQQLESRVDRSIALLHDRDKTLLSMPAKERSEVCDSVSPVFDQFTEILVSFSELDHPLEDLDDLQLDNLLVGLLKIESAGKATREYMSIKEASGAHQVSPEEYIRGLVEALTHRKLPDEVKFHIGEIAERGIIGLSNFVKQEIIAEDGDYVYTTLTFAHEAGHLLAQHHEDFAGCTQQNRSLHEVRIWEEACAYAFQFTAASHMCTRHPEYAERAEQTSRDCHFENLIAFYTMGKVADPHPEGMAIFDAAWEELGSCAAAYNYLSSHKELTPSMHGIIERNRKRLSSCVLSVDTMKLIRKTSEARDAVQDKLLALSELLEESLRVDNKGVRLLNWGIHGRSLY